MIYFDGVLANQSYLAGDKFSMADITAYCALLHAAFVGITVPEELPALAAWQAGLNERPSIKNRSGQ
jgi:glutathione S-transferase